MPLPLVAPPLRARRSPRALLAFVVAQLVVTVAAPLAAQDTVRTTRDSVLRDTVRLEPARSDSVRPDSARRATADSVAPDSARRAVSAPKAKTPPRGWPVKGPAPLPGSILPNRRIVAYYGNPLSKRMGALGQYPVDEMLARLDKEVARWNAADPSTPVQPALHLIAVVAQGDPGPSGKWRLRMRDSLIERVYGWAKRKNAILFLDVQVGTGTLKEELPPLEKFLSRPDVHLGIDPEFSMKGGHKPGSRIGTYDAADINYASKFLQDLVTKHGLPPKVLVIHRFTRPMVTNYQNIRLDPRVQIVMHMDGWGPKRLKEDSYAHYIVREPVQFTGFKLFYGNDTKKAGSKLMTPQEVLALDPKPVYIQYQ